MKRSSIGRAGIRAARGGYTLIEMAVVLVIICVLLLVIVGRVDYLLPKYRLRASVREIASTLRLARSQAMASGMTHFVQYDVPNGKYWILAPEKKNTTTGSEEPEDTTENAFKDAEYQWVKTMDKTLPTNVKFEKIWWSEGEEADSMPVTVEVTPYGAIRRHTVWVTGTEDGGKFTVTANQVTGFIDFKDGYVAPSALEKDQDK